MKTAYLKSLRNELKLKQVDLAQLLGRSLRKYQQMETNNEDVPEQLIANLDLYFMPYLRWHIQALANELNDPEYSFKSQAIVIWIMKKGRLILLRDTVVLNRKYDLKGGSDGVVKSLESKSLTTLPIKGQMILNLNKKGIETNPGKRFRNESAPLMFYSPTLELAESLLHIPVKMVEGNSPFEYDSVICLENKLTAKNDIRKFGSGKIPYTDKEIADIKSIVKKHSRKIGNYMDNFNYLKTPQVIDMEERLRK